MGASYQKLPHVDKKILLRSLLALNFPFPSLSTAFPANIFLENIQHALTLICKLLGRDHDRVMDGTTLGFFSLLLSADSIAALKYDFYEFLKEPIQIQLENFHRTCSFRYLSYLVYLILSYNHSYFKRWGI